MRGLYHGSRGPDTIHIVMLWKRGGQYRNLDFDVLVNPSLGCKSYYPPLPINIEPSLTGLCDRAGKRALTAFSSQQEAVGCSWPRCLRRRYTSSTLGQQYTPQLAKDGVSGPALHNVMCRAVELDRVLQAGMTGRD